MALADKIQSKEARIGIIGLGYVGLPLAVEFASKGFHTLGVDVDADKVRQLADGDNYIQDVDGSRLKACVDNGRLTASTSYDGIDETDIVFICVPTPFTENKEPDISFIVGAAEAVVPHLHKDQLVILWIKSDPLQVVSLSQFSFDLSGLNIFPI